MDRICKSCHKRILPGEAAQPGEDRHYGCWKTPKPYPEHAQLTQVSPTIPKKRFLNEKERKQAHERVEAIKNLFLHPET